MAIPAAVQRQADRSDEILREMQAATAAPAPAPEASATLPVEPAAADTPPSETAPGFESGTATVVEGAPPADDTPTEIEGHTKRVDWKHKFFVLEGKYRAEVPRLHAEKKSAVLQTQEAQGKVAQLTRELSELRSARPDTGDSDDTEFDPALEARILRRANEAADRAVGERVAPISERLDTHESTAKATAQVSFEGDVEDILQDSHNVSWRDVDTQEKWHAYLAGQHPLTGQPRQHLLNAAVAERDSSRAAALFQDFLGAPKAAKPTTTPARTPAVDPRLALVVPDRAVSGAAIVEPEARTWTRNQVREFYTAYSKAQVNRSTTPAEMERYRSQDTDIQAAMRDGRIR